MLEVPDVPNLRSEGYSTPFGSVYLVGAGPGDPGLITVRGREALRRADVVVHDRLVSPDLLKEVCVDAEVIDVGKTAGQLRRSQDEINTLLVEHARRGRQVVRLKGGDPFVFGRGMEEVAACEAAGVPVTVVPGISSAIAGPAAAGIPVTARGLAASVAIIAAHRADDAALAPALLAALVRIDTLVVLMGRSNLRTFAGELMAAGRDPATPAACVQEATTGRQRTTVATLDTIAQAAERDRIASPMVLVIGTVAALAEKGVTYATLIAAERDVARGWRSLS